MHQCFQQVLQVFLKGLEDPNQHVLEQFIQTLYHLLNLRLQESSQQGDIKTSFKIYNQQQREALQGKDKKKSTQVFYDLPRTLSDMISFLCSVLFRLQVSATNANQLDYQRYALGQVMVRLIETNRVHLEVLDPENIITPLLLCLLNKNQQGPQVQDVDSFKQRELSIWIISQALYNYESEQKVLILKSCLQCLLKKQLIMNKDTLDTYQGFSKNQKVTTLLNESQILALLRISNEIIFRLQSLDLKKAFANEKDLIDPILPLIKDSGSNVIRVYAIEFIKSLGYKCPHLIHELISIFLSLATITNADITTLRQVPYHLYSLDRSAMRPDSQILYENINNLNYQSYALGLLLSSLNQCLGGVPLALINQTINVAKGMILGNWKVGEDEDEFFFSNDLQKVDIQENQRREAGWFIFEGLVHLGNQWMGTKLSLFFKLLNSVFTKDMCVINHLQIKDQAYCEKILNEFKIKKAALSTLKSFLQKSFVLLNNSLMKLVSTFLINAVGFFINHDKEKKDINKLFSTFFPTEYQQVKIDLYDCLLMIPSSLYQSKFVNLLHSVCEQIVSEDIQEIPSLHKSALHYEDRILQHRYQQPLLKHIGQQNSKQMKITNAEELFIIEQNLQLFRFEQTICQTKYSKLSVKMNILNSSIQLFAEIFSSSHLNLKNKQQLIKHFLSHTQPQSQQQTSKKEKTQVQNQGTEQKINKVISIALSVLLICKNMAKKGELMDQEIEAQIITIFKSCDSFQNMTLLRIVSEGIVFLNIPQILKDPIQKLDSFIKEQEVTFQQLTQMTQVDEWQKKTKILCILGNLCRSLDYETILQPQIKRILELFMKLGKENNNNIREHFVHYSYIITKRLGNDNPAIFQNLFPTCFHQMQTDVKTNYVILNSLGRLLEVQLRQNLNPVNEMRKSQIIIKEFLEILFVRDEKMSKDINVLKTCLDIIKTYMILDIDRCKLNKGNFNYIVHDQIEDIIKKVLIILKANDLINIDVKIKCVEILGALIYKGYYYVISSILEQNHKSELLQFILNLTNNTYELRSSSYQDFKIIKKVYESTDKIMNYNDEFEKLINFKQNQNFDNEKLLHSASDKETYKTIICRYCSEVLYTKCFKISSIINFKQSLEHVKSIITYSHTSQLQKYEETKKVGEKSEMTQDITSQRLTLNYNIHEKVRFLVAKAFKTYLSLYGQVDSQDQNNDLRKYLGQLISLGFSIISDESVLLKRVGFSMVITLVKLFKYSIEKLGDDDEDATNQLQIYLNNPLLLEQYEAQLFSIIRQNIATSNVKLIDPQIVIKNYKLIYYFLTAPICRDQQIIGKIVQMLTDNLQQNLQIFNSSEMMFYEKALTDMHFKKLMLLSKLLIICLEGKEFQRVETNLKKVVDGTVKNQDDSQSQQNSKFPSKFQKEDRDRIVDQLQPQVVQNIIKHLVAALQDSFMILTMPKSSIKSIKDFIFIYKNGSRSAYNQETIEKSIQHFIKALSIINDNQKFKQEQVLSKLNEDQSLILNGIITFYLSREFQTKTQGKDKKNQEQEDNQDDDKILIYNMIQLKTLYLGLLNKYLIDNKLSIKTNDEIDLYVRILDNLQTYGITELNEEIVQFYSTQIKTSNFGLSQNDNQRMVQIIEQSIPKILKILATVQPEFVGHQREVSEEYSKNEIKLIKTCMDTLQLIGSHLLQFKSNQSVELYKKLCTFMIYRVGISLKDISNESLLKFYTNTIVQFTNQSKVFIQDNGLDSMVTEFIVLIIKQLTENNMQNTQALQFMLLNVINLIPIITNQDEKGALGLALDQLFQQKENQQIIQVFIKLYTQQLQKDPKAASQISKDLLTQAITTIFQSIKQNQQTPLQQQQYLLMQDLIAFMMTTYQQVLNTQERSEILSQYMLMIFTIIQERNLEAGFRNAQAELIFKLFQADQQAFKEYLLSPDTTVNEKTLIQKIIQQFAVLAATGGLNKSQGPNGNQNLSQASESQMSQSQAADSGGAKQQGKIQLTMSFNKK